MELNASQKKYLRGLTHHINPVVMVADKGLTDNVMAEIEQALAHHELVKIKLRGEKDARTRWVGSITESTGAALVHEIGQVASFYRRNPDNPKIALPG